MRKGMLAPRRELKLVQKSNESRVLRGLVDLVNQSARARQRGKSRWRDLNPQPPLYESGALPLSYIGIYAMFLGI